MAIRMKMKQKKIRKIGIVSALGLVVLVMLGLYGASNYTNELFAQLSEGGENDS